MHRFESQWLATVVALGVGAGSTATAQSAPGDSAAVAAAVEGYHAALARGDSVAALEMLAPDAVIVESGNIETREHYRSGHLRGDIGFAMAVPRQRSPINVVVSGNTAWATSTAVTQGTYRDREINSTSAELMVLSREGRSWKIRAVHWSSRRRGG